MTTENKTVVQNEDAVFEEDGVVDSGSSDVSPGHLVESYGNTDYGLNTTTVQENPEVRVARAHKEIGHEAADGNDPYASGDHLKVARCASGAVVQVKLASGTDVSASSEVDISEGDRIVTAGGATAGCVKGYDSANDSTGAVFAVAREAVDNSTANAGVSADITVEVL